MNRKQWLVVIGAMSLVVGGSDCAKSGKPADGVDTAKSIDTAGPTPPPPTRGHTVEGFLSDTGQTYKYDLRLVASLCKLEVKLRGRDTTKRLCPTGNPRDVVIPSYPPKDSLAKRSRR